MPTPKPKTFRARLEPLGNALNWTIARVPFDIAKAWPERRGRRVRGSINGFAFRTSLFPVEQGEGHYILVNKQMQAAAGVHSGGTAEFHLEPDFEEREVILSPELSRILNSEPGLRKWFNALSAARRRELGRFTLQPKSAEGRQKRAEQTAERLMLAMEGELETPPVLKAAFQRQPLAEAGWKAMTSTQRRGHLLGIFYYASPEARQRRAQQAIDQAIAVARRKS